MLDFIFVLFRRYTPSPEGEDLIDPHYLIQQMSAMSLEERMAIAVSFIAEEEPEVVARELGVSTDEAQRISLEALRKLRDRALTDLDRHKINRSLKRGIYWADI